MRLFLITLAAFGLIAAAAPLGSAKKPVRADGPAGERAYLDRLRCSDGARPEYKRRGSVGSGPYSSIMDLYDVRCAYGEPAQSEIYMDMYHKRVETQPVPGFTIVPQ